jgi:membrane protein implicated in regulation of membrane protease activity
LKIQPLPIAILRSLFAVVLSILLALTIAGLSTLLRLSRRKKFGQRTVQLIGTIAMVNSTLAPEGTVLIRGEVWRACSKDGSMISARAQVEVVAARDHLLLVERW